MDPVHFTGAELINIAVRIEENGMRYYTDASRTARSRKVKDLFKLLADEEGTHVKVFKDLKKFVPDEEIAEGFDAYMEEASMYLGAVADTRVFTDPSGGKDLGKAAADESAVLDFAIGMEKDSLLFYYELQRMIRDKDKPVIEGLIEQEKAHLSKLTGLKDELAGGR